MPKMGPVHDVLETLVPDRDLDMKSKPVEAILQDCPEQNSNRNQPDQIARVVLGIAPEGKVQKDNSN